MMVQMDSVEGNSFPSWMALKLVPALRRLEKGCRKSWGITWPLDNFHGWTSKTRNSPIRWRGGQRIAPMWTTHARIAKRVHGTPATSAPSEQLIQRRINCYREAKSLIGVACWGPGFLAHFLGSCRDNKELRSCWLHLSLHFCFLAKRNFLPSSCTCCGCCKGILRSLYPAQSGRQRYHVKIRYLQNTFVESLSWYFHRPRSLKIHCWKFLTEATQPPTYCNKAFAFLLIVVSAWARSSSFKSMTYHTLPSSSISDKQNSSCAWTRTKNNQLVDINKKLEHARLVALHPILDLKICWTLFSRPFQKECTTREFHCSEETYHSPAS